MHNSEIKNEAVRLYGMGISTYEIGSMLGVGHNTVSKWANSAGLYRGKGRGCATESNAKRNDEALSRMSRLLGDRFLVLELQPRSRAELKCKSCGYVFQRTVDLRCTTTCPECRRREVEQRESERRLRQIRGAIVRALRGVLKVKEREEREREFLDTVHVCKECGKEFTLRERRETNPWDYSDNPTFCCSTCSKRHHRRESRHRRRERCEHSGRGVSLRELEERDHHACYLCGCITDRMDYEIDEDGNFTAGPTYPSIDHVLPLSKGGRHSMDNARLACIRCNSLKGTKTVEQAMERIAGFQGVA